MPPAKRKASKKAVRFNPEAVAAAVAAADDGTNGGERKRPTVAAVAAGDGILKIKKRRLNDRPNEDEMDDVDDWVPEDDEVDDDEVDPSLPSKKELLEAKRARRQKRQHGGTLDGDDLDKMEDDMDSEDDDDIANNNGASKSTLDDTSRSLATEGIAVEPFHMKNETNDGTGYFDGDTYVFRHGKDQDEEPDAWLDSLNAEGNGKGVDNNDQDDNDDADSSSDMDSGDDKKKSSSSSPELTKEEWYAKIYPLMSDKETIMQAVVRYGGLLKRTPLKNAKKNHKPKRKQQHEEEGDNNGDKMDPSETKADHDKDEEVTVAAQAAQKSLNDLTEASSALLNMGDVDIYQKTRQDLSKLIPADTAAALLQATSAATASSSAVPTVVRYWEYKGNQDGQIHGPYTSEQMKGWIQAGYFVGEQAVQVRTVTTPTSTAGTKEAPKKSKEDDVKDLLSDLMDDDDDEGEEDKNKEGKDNSAAASEPEQAARGEWVSSEEAIF